MLVIARPPAPQWKIDIIKKLAQAVNVPGGSKLLREKYAPGVAIATGWEESTVCKYTEEELGKHHREEW